MKKFGYAARASLPRGSINALTSNEFFHKPDMRVELPEPELSQHAHSERVATFIRAEIACAGGAIDFSRYMDLALYAPGLGYYSAGATKFGRAGDFVTAPEIGCLFARCLARPVIESLRQSRSDDGARDVLELGPGSGVLAAELLLELERLDALPRRYLLLERSADLRARQHELLSLRCAHLLGRIEWLDAPPREPWCGVLIANEVVDALAVTLFALRDNGIYRRMVGVDRAGAFTWREECADDTFVAMLTDRIGSEIHRLPRPYESEICAILPAWLAEVTRALAGGSAFFIDYGFGDGAYYAAQRRRGTLQCHFRHRVHDDPLILPGIQDITASVDFDALAHAGSTAGFEVIAQSTQAQFLIAHELAEVFADAYAAAPDEAARYALAQQAKQLTLPSAMGERFRVMHLQRRA